jgi:hypothetical protein
MSFWIYQKEKNGKTSVYSVSIPFLESIIIVMALIAAILAPGYMCNSTQFGIDSMYLSAVGFLLVLISKITLFKRGIWNSWGSKQMTTPFKSVYLSGYTLIGLGVFVQSIFLFLNR